MILAALFCMPYSCLELIFCNGFIDNHRSISDNTQNHQKSMAWSQLGSSHFIFWGLSLIVIMLSGNLLDYLIQVIYSNINHLYLTP
jgi:hypothetical protein